MTSRIIHFTVFIIFFIWILPLGAFIKPNQEKTACNGARAICLCSHLLAKKMAKVSGKDLLKNAAASEQKEASGGANHDYILAKKIVTPGLPGLLFTPHVEISLQSPSRYVPESVPKA